MHQTGSVTLASSSWQSVQQDCFARDAIEHEGLSCSFVRGRAPPGAPERDTRVRRFRFLPAVPAVEWSKVVTSIRSSYARHAAAFLMALGLSPCVRAQVFDYDLLGPPRTGSFGIDVNRIGDVDRDGCEDFIVGASDILDVSFGGEAVVYSGRTGAVLASIDGNAGSALGSSVDGGIDSDGDGYPDVIIGAPFDNAAGGSVYGRVVVFSPHRNLILLDLYSSGFEELGNSVRSLLDDIDRDGVNDFIAGAAIADKAYVYSGATGSLLYTVNGQAGSYFGLSVSSGGDLNGDGVADFLIGAPDRANSSGTFTGQVTAWSGRDGSKLWTTNGATNSLFGSSIASPGDLDGDGIRDCVVGVPAHLDPGGNKTGAVTVLSGATGSVLYKVYGDQTGDYLGMCVNAVGGDLDQDGTSDFISGAPYANGTRGYVRLYSGASGSVLFTYHEKTSDPAVSSYYGGAAGGGDFNGDGRADVLIGGASFNSGQGIVETWTAAVAKWSNYGGGWPGTLGAPALTAGNNPVVGQSLDLLLSNSAGVTTAGVMIVGTSEAYIPTGKGGTLFVEPLLYIPVSIPSGGLTLSGSIPNDPSLHGFDLYLQALELDAGAWRGVSFTPGLDLYFGYP